MRGWPIRIREKNAGVVSPPNSIQQDAGNVCPHKKTVIWLNKTNQMNQSNPSRQFCSPCLSCRSLTYFFFARSVPVVPTMTTTFVWGEKACSTRGFPLVARITIPL